MKRYASWAVLAGFAAAAALGCAVDPQRAMQDPEQRRLELARTYHDYFDEAAANAVVRQATVFPYHFEPRSAVLTDLGRHELSILASYLRANPGEVKLRGDGPEDRLWEARSRAVVAFLRDRGVDEANVRVVEGAPDGDGMASERVVRALAAEDERPTSDESEKTFMPTFKQGTSNASTLRNTK